MRGIVALAVGCGLPLLATTPTKAASVKAAHTGTGPADTAPAGTGPSDTARTRTTRTGTAPAGTGPADTTRTETTRTETVPAGTVPADTTRTETTTARTAPAKAEMVVLRPGDRGANVLLLQRKLHRRGYYFGNVNGVYDDQTKFAVWAFQKKRRLTPQGAVGPGLWRALERPVRNRPLVPTGADNRVEIDLSRQLLTVYRHRRPVLISHMSTGAERSYCEKGHCGNAVTPVGDFRVTKRSPGWSTGPLGAMYNSLYFVGGIAIHGSTKVPLTPASHGCVRIPLTTSVRLYRMVQVGEPVYVRGKAYTP
ncbi:L,D-transpeptidase family protein [Nonomuraea sp. NPDC046802]|uniref:L,D-transpeptidase family protein n=1 Tax=Nonomuraea sp. NPDC046802 TaxID=3154919 RepID=UPI0033DA39E3